MYKCIHLLFGTALLGIFMFNYLILLRQNNSILLKISLKIDYCLLGTIVVMFITGTLLVPEYQWTYHTPWIEAAYGLLSVITLLIFNNIIFKRKKIKNPVQSLNFLFHLSQLIGMVILILISKDAVTKHTWF